MKWILLVLALIFFFFIACSFDTSIMVFRNRWHWWQKVYSIFLIWAIPVFGLYFVRRKISSERGIENEGADFTRLLDEDFDLEDDVANLD